MSAVAPSVPSADPPVIDLGPLLALNAGAGLSDEGLWTLVPPCAFAPYPELVYEGHARDGSTLVFLLRGESVDAHLRESSGIARITSVTVVRITPWLTGGAGARPVAVGVMSFNEDGELVDAGIDEESEAAASGIDDASFLRMCLPVLVMNSLLNGMHGRHAEDVVEAPLRGVRMRA